MKIIHLLDETNRGGAEILTLDVCRNARQNGLEMLLISMRSGDLEKEFENSGITYLKLNRKKLLDIKAIFELRKIIKKYEVKIIHSHIVVSAAYAYLASIGLNVKKILTHHGFSTNPKKIDDLWSNFLIPRLNMNIVVSNSFLERLLTDKGIKQRSNFRVIYNGIDKKKFDIKDIKETHSTIRLGMVGNFINNKDQITVCRALLEVKKTHPIFKFLFVGRRDEAFPEEYDTCYNYCKENGLLENVEFLGKRNDVLDILNSLDIFVFSSLNESFGIAPVEAMFLGLPVILSDIDVMREISMEGKYALLYEAGNDKELAEKIIKLMKDQTLRIKLGKESKEYVSQKFSIESHIKNLLKLYNEL